jgi:predicted nuclease of predicted toxin-antitoxin system
MKIKIDENLPDHLATALINLGHNAHTLREEGLAGHSDREVWKAVQKESRFLITQDLDFSDRRQFAAGSHHGILLIRLRSPKQKDLIRRIEQLFQNENIAEWYGCFIVASERKIRVQKPPIN